MIGPFDGQEYNEEPGCYVSGGWGWHGIYHMAEQFSGFVSPSEWRLLTAYDRGWTVGGLPEVASEIADKVEERISEALPEGLIAMWHDGEFFISEYCGGDWGDNDDCDNEECACHVW